MAIGRWCPVAVSPIAVASLVARTRICATVKPQILEARRVHVADSPYSKEHLNAYNDKNRSHGYEARHGRVTVVPEMGKTWVRERLEGGREQVDKGSRDQDACPKVPGYEEELVRHGYRGKALDNDGEGASCAQSAGH